MLKYTLAGAEKMALDEQTKELFNPNDEEIEKFFKEVFKDKKAGDKISFIKICDSFYEKYKISFERKYLFKSFINLKSKNLNINFDICIKNDECLCVPDNNELKKFTINFLFANNIGKKINIEQAKTAFIQKYNFEEGWSSDIFCKISSKTFF